CQRELAARAKVDAERERIAAIDAELKAECQRKADEARQNRLDNSEYLAEQRAAAEARESSPPPVEPATVIELAAHRSVKGRPRVDCTECGKRHYVRVNGCGRR